MRARAVEAAAVACVMVGVVLTAGLSGFTPVAASGGYLGNLNCQHSEIHLYASTACLDGSYTGGPIAQFRTAFYTSPAPTTPTGYEQNMLRVFSGSPCTAYASVGTDYQSSGYPHPYNYYSEYKTAGGVVYRSEWGSSYATALNYYKVVWNGGTTFEMYLGDSTESYTDLGTATGQGYAGCQGQVGWEETASPGTTGVTSNGTYNNNTFLWVNTSNGSGQLINTNDVYIDWPCGANGNVSPNCLNGAMYGGGNQWSDNNP